MCIGQKIDDDATLYFTDLGIRNSNEVEILGITLETWTFILILKIFVEKQAKNQALCQQSVLTLIKERKFYYRSQW